MLYELTTLAAICNTNSREWHFLFFRFCGRALGNSVMVMLLVLYEKIQGKFRRDCKRSACFCGVAQETLRYCDNNTFNQCKLPSLANFAIYASPDLLHDQTANTTFYSYSSIVFHRIQFFDVPLILRQLSPKKISRLIYWFQSFFMSNSLYFDHLCTTRLGY